MEWTSEYYTCVWRAYGQCKEGLWAECAVFCSLSCFLIWSCLWYQPVWGEIIFGEMYMGDRADRHQDALSSCIPLMLFKMCLLHMILGQLSRADRGLLLLQQIRSSAEEAPHLLFGGDISHRGGQCSRGGTALPCPQSYGPAARLKNIGREPHTFPVMLLIEIFVFGEIFSLVIYHVPLTWASIQCWCCCQQPLRIDREETSGASHCLILKWAAVISHFY